MEGTDQSTVLRWLPNIDFKYWHTMFCCLKSAIITPNLMNRTSRVLMSCYLREGKIVFAFFNDNFLTKNIVPKLIITFVGITATSVARLLPKSSVTR